MAFAIFNRAITGRRRATGSYFNGVWVPGEASDITIRGSVQPAAAKDISRILERLPEGSRITSAFKVYTKDVVALGDILMLHGSFHEVMMLDIWQNRVLEHLCATCVKMQEERSL